MELKKITAVVLLVLIAVISVTKVAPWAGDPQNHVHSVEQTDQKIATVMTLSGGAAGTAAVLSLLPGDMCTPIAEQLAELAKYFLLILSALYLEKFMIGISGYVAFGLLIPAACLIWSAGILAKKKNWGTVALKIAVLGLILYLIVPASVKLSDMVYQTQAEIVNQTVEDYNNLDIDGETDGGFFDQITTIADDTVNKVSGFLSGLLESLAVMIVTACIIPLLVFVFLVWLLKNIFTSNVLTLDVGSLDSLRDKLKKQT